MRVQLVEPVEDHDVDLHGTPCLRARRRPRQWQDCHTIAVILPGTIREVHRIAVLALDSVVAFDLGIAAQVFGHPDERDRYALTVCGERAGPVQTSTGFAVVATHGLQTRARAPTP